MSVIKQSEVSNANRKAALLTTEELDSAQARSGKSDGHLASIHQSDECFVINYMERSCL